MRFLIAILGVLSLQSPLSLAGQSPIQQSRLPCEKPWVFFDLGGTVVDTKDNSFENMTYMPGAHEYLKDLKAKGYSLGMLINWPENEGSTLAEKQRLLREFIEKGWAPAPAPAFDWSLFEEAAVLLPELDSQRKPAPDLFVAGRDMARNAGCSAFFQGEVPDEVRAARRNRMGAYLVGAPGQPFFLPEKWLRRFGNRRVQSR